MRGLAPDPPARSETQKLFVLLVDLGTREDAGLVRPLVTIHADEPQFPGDGRSVALFSKQPEVIRFFLDRIGPRRRSLFPQLGQPHPPISNVR